MENKQKPSEPTLSNSGKQLKVYSNQGNAESRKGQLRNGSKALWHFQLSLSHILPAWQYTILVQGHSPCLQREQSRCYKQITVSAYSILSLGLCEELTQGTPLYLRRKVIGETYSTMPKAWEEMLEREYTLKKKNTHETLSRTERMLSHKKSLKNFFFFFFCQQKQVYSEIAEKRLKYKASWLSTMK